jgi:hypothetical protein
MRSTVHEKGVSFKVILFKTVGEDWMRTKVLGAALILLLSCASAVAQQTTGNIAGRVVDQQGAGVPGATLTATSSQTGFTRTEPSDSAGLYRLNALPVGVYDVTAELPGFATVSRQAVEVSIASTLSLDFSMKIAGIAETVNVVGATPLIETSSSSVGQVVDLRRIERLPLNGRQFANLAATVPGVGIGLHGDTTKGTTFAPQINGGGGRNVNYLIDGGDNNDDTVGGLLQQFPLEAIQEFNFQTQRFKAEYGRSNGGVMNIVTKSGTNQFQGSLFELFRDTSMNALTTTEKLAVLGTTREQAKGDYRRNQFGGSIGGPIAQNKAHFFMAIERTQEDRQQSMGAAVVALAPSEAGSAPVRYRENLGTGKVAMSLNSAQYLSIRYGRNNNSFPDGAAPNRTPDNWGDATNEFNSINVNHNWVIGSSKLNEFIFQYADFTSQIAARTTAPFRQFPNGVLTGSNPNAPQATEQRKFQFRDDFSWHVTGRGGLGHDLKAGVNLINEPRLFIINNTLKGVTFNVMLNNDANGPVRALQLSDGESNANIPNTQYGVYFQDDWRASDRLTVNAGLRYDLVTGIVFDQSLNPNFVKVQEAARAGRLAGIVGLENFGLDPQADRNNIQPRIGAVYDVKGNGTDVIRGGWGIYTDFGYTNSNVLFAALDASGTHFGPIFQAQVTTGLRNTDGSFYQVGQPLTNVAAPNQASGPALIGFWADPRLQQPRQLQSNIGWSHQLMADTIVTVDYVNSIGRDLNYKPRLNQLIPGTGTRRISALLSSPLNANSSANRPALSRGKSEYNAIIFGARRRLSKGVDFSTSYTLARARSTIGEGSDETNLNNIQDANNPFDAPVQMGPNRTTDARHRVNITAIVELPYGISVAPFFLYRSALPVFLVDGRDLNGDGELVDIPTTAYAVDGVDRATGTATIKEIGPCETVNCGRSSPQSQLNLRVSKTFRIAGHVRVEAIGEIFNLFNALNPATASGRVTVPTTGAKDPTLLQPQSYSGDVRRPEQRVGQVGFRFTF